MDTPTITLTLLGASGSGKTLFLHGMYATLSAGVAGYFVYTRDPDDDVDLMDVWDRLNDKGTLPPPTDMDGQKSYEFVFTHGIDPLLHIDCVDFRGGATDGKSGDADDSQAIHDRLLVSDSIYLVLDGEHLANWVLAIRDLDDVGASRPNRSRDPMKVAGLSRLIYTAVKARQEQGKLPPSLVLLITKSDLIEPITGMSRGTALSIAARHMKALVPIAYSDGMTSLVCPVQIGRLGTELHGTVDPDALDPVGLHRPFVFSLWYYLVEQIQNNRTALSYLREQRSDARQTVDELRSRLGGTLLHRGKIRAGERTVGTRDQQIQEVERELAALQSLADKLIAELGRLPIVTDGRARLVLEEVQR
ncbi:hypothetical protein O7623_08910 [Solwaraspora sp. WMMD791]|uniref:hypothetical protein n=1 Tax=Solwaraspora sp. WMMD791 TaxID=3016086 RepID=UPI00249BAE29|nr:hypothetical protein [Solwaraspora sp. WMMD791]WFE29290.1 hypothetical protein O7623_08910 [Solwaraspora sp. WMMD791]